MTLGAALLVVIGGAALYAAFDSMFSFTPSETPRERDARERAAKSVIDLERLLETRTCEECQIYGAELAGKVDQLDLDDRGAHGHHHLEPSLGVELAFDLYGLTALRIARDVRCVCDGFVMDAMEQYLEAELGVLRDDQTRSRSSSSP